MTSIGFIAFFSLSVFGLSNVIKFRTIMSVSMSLFYALAVLTLLTRAAYYLSELFGASLQARTILTVLPASFLLGVTASQLNIYIQLIFRLKAVEETFRTSDIGNQNKDKKLQYQENTSLAVCIFVAILYPVAFSV